MKTLPAKLRFVVIGVATVVVVVGCCNLPFIKDTAIELGHDVSGKRTYVEWKDEKTFETALEHFVDHGGKICLCVLKDPRGKPHPHKLNNDCGRNYDCPSPANIKTVRVTKSMAADEIAAGGSAVNDPNITHIIRSLSATEISDVLKTLKP
jgi:hypothetical protein